jgi:hypothetical protein
MAYATMVITEAREFLRKLDHTGAIPYDQRRRIAFGTGAVRVCRGLTQEEKLQVVRIGLSVDEKIEPSREIEGSIIDKYAVSVLLYCSDRRPRIAI